MQLQKNTFRSRRDHQADPDVARFLGSGKPRTRKESIQALRATVALLERVGLGQIAVREKTQDKIIGRCGINPFLLDSGLGSSKMEWLGANILAVINLGPSHFELGDTFGNEFWGQGYASVASVAVRDWGLGNISATLISLIHPDNIGSIKIALKNGMRREMAVEFSGRSVDIYATSK